jgi:hypothetical protein
MLLPLLLAVPLLHADPTVTIEVDRPRYDSGAEIAASVTNAMGEPIFVSACETMQVEVFDADQGRWLPASSGGCRETKPAVGLAEGAHSLTARHETDRFTVVRLVLVFGLRCREGFSLEMAGCEEFRAATSSNITVAPPEE